MEEAVAFCWLQFRFQ